MKKTLAPVNYVFNNVSIPEIQCYTINGKAIYVFDSHNYALLPWIEYYRRQHSLPPGLITIDQHSDTIRAYQRVYFETAGQPSSDGLRQFARSKINAIAQPYDISKIYANEAFSMLKNDEHISAAIQMGVLSFVIVICHSNTNGDRPESKDPEFGKIFYIENKYQINDESLGPAILVMNQMEKTNEYKRYILDFDLDYFTNYEQLNPEKRDAFSLLVKHAGIITIAREPGYVAENVEKFQNASKDLSSTKLLNLLLDRIAEATNGDNVNV